MAAYYNEIDKYCVKWLKNLIKEGLIAPGEVDDRPIQEVLPSEVAAFTQCHFFAGIGGWSFALRLANWSDESPCWTGSAPCQPFSIAGAGKGVDDKRHLWPEFWRLIAAEKPPTIFGEQVASPAGRDWFAGVRTDLEALGYEVGGADLCAAGVGAPHIRQRLYFGASRGGQVGWPTPLANDAEKRGNVAPEKRNGLPGIAQALKGWTTPQNHDHSKPNPDRHGRFGTKHGGRNLNDEAAAVLRDVRMFPPADSHRKHDDGRQTGRIEPTNLCGWPTPRASPNENRNTKSAPSHGVTHGLTLSGVAQGLKTL